MRSSTFVCLALVAAGCATLRGRPAPSGKTPPDTAWLAGVRFPEGASRLPVGQERALVARLEELGSGDFGTYSDAARGLVDSGESVLPYLGHAATHAALDSRARACLRIVLRTILEDLPEAKVSRHLVSPYPALRVAAAEAAGQRHMTGVAAKLVDLLDDPELEVRRAAITGLRRISNHFFGYRPDDLPARRARAALLWREFWGAS